MSDFPNFIATVLVDLSFHQTLTHCDVSLVTIQGEAEVGGGRGGRMRGGGLSAEQPTPSGAQSARSQQTCCGLLRKSRKTNNFTLTETSFLSRI